eukprot:m.49144 g.49144  ORF g.49144 m.49144 type:complete len:156 (+) comp11075_c0_seq8:1678-2145(+)
MHNMSCIVLCELIGRISADPDDMPRTSNFGVDIPRFKAHFAGDCPESFLSHALAAADVDPDLRPSFEGAEAQMRKIWMKLDPLIHSQIESAIAVTTGIARQHQRRHKIAGNAVIPGSPTLPPQRSAPSLCLGLKRYITYVHMKSSHNDQSMRIVL